MEEEGDDDVPAAVDGCMKWKALQAGDRNKYCVKDELAMKH